MNTKNNNYGLILESPIPFKEFIFGGYGSMGGVVLQPDANWSGWLPDNEFQNMNGIETTACVSFATTNIIEILERKEYGAITNLSDRFLTKISGTMPGAGNTPQKVSETLRKKGCIEEKEWPFDSSINTVEKFYTDIPQNLQTLALAFIAEYNFGHEFVPSNPQALMEALKYSPLGFSAYAWVKDENGLYYRPQGMTDGHFTVCYGYEEGKYWKIFDSYLNDGVALKKVRWDSLPMQAKRYTLHREIKVENAWIRFITLLRRILKI